MAKRIRYNEGQWFAVPLQPAGYALGLIVRGKPAERRAVGYFFGPQLPPPPDRGGHRRQTPPGRRPDRPVRRSRHRPGEWPLLATRRPWNRADWPLPQFVRRDVLSSAARLVEYDEETGVHEVRTTRDRFRGG